MDTQTKLVYTHTLTPAERQVEIKAHLRQAEESFVNAALLIREAYDREDWRVFGRKNFDEYANVDLGVSEKWAYDLVRLARVADVHTEFIPRMIDVGISKMRLLLPQIEEHPQDADMLDGLLDEASGSTWRDLHSTLRQQGTEREREMVEAHCPACGAKLKLSRSANIWEA